MNAMLFDTHRMVKHWYRPASPTSKQSRLTDAVSAARGFDIEILATKDELKQEISLLKAELRQEIAELRADFKQDVARLDAKIADSKAEILRWVIGLAIAQSGLLITLLRFAPGH